MTNTCFTVPEPCNEPVRSHAPGSAEQDSLQACLDAMRTDVVEIPLIVGGREIRTGDTFEVRTPHEHGCRLAICHRAGPREVERAIESALTARRAWADLPWEQRAAVFLRAAELLSGPWRDTLNAATMLGQSKTVHQAEIDSACELIDFWRFNAYYLAQIIAGQPRSAPGSWNRMEYRALEGFVLAVTPFNFTAIGGNLPTAPVLTGNVALWKPACASVYANYLTFRLLEAAGLPPGVINFLPGDGELVAATALAHPDLAGVHFTGSSKVFNAIWSQVGGNIGSYRQYPRLVGETGGKDFIFVHPSAAALLDELVAGTLRGAFEFQGQKCSAASRMYVPRSVWPDFRARFTHEVGRIRIGDPTQRETFMGAVIDVRAFRRIKAYIDAARTSGEAEIVTGGQCDDSRGYFIEPTTIVTTNPRFPTMAEEIFGPVLTIYVYNDDEIEQALKLCDETSPYALTGAIWARDRAAIALLSDRLRQAAGNFYINDKPTGAVVGQQPFGGARASGTNDKAGSPLNLLRWMSARTIKETYAPPSDWRYEYMGAE